jgi:hypothetical protein
MNRTGIIVAVAALVVGGVIGYLLNSGPSEADRILARYPIDLSGIGGHAHNLRDLPEDAPVPSVSLEVIPDEMKERQYMLHIQTENFTFAPESISSDDVLGEGHAHVYIDDVMISRAVSPWYHIPKLEPGEHEIKVTLNWNEHDEYSRDGRSIQAVTTITVPE